MCVLGGEGCGVHMCVCECTCECISEFQTDVVTLLYYDNKFQSVDAKISV